MKQFHLSLSAALLLATALLSPARAGVILLNSEVEPNSSAGQATALDASSGFVASTGSIGPLGNDVDYFSFTATAGARVWITVDTGGPISNPAHSRDSRVALIAPDGTTVIESDDDNGYGNGWDNTRETELSSAIAGARIPVTGKYFVRVREYHNNPADQYVIEQYVLSIVVTTGSPKSEAAGNHSTATAMPLVTRTIPGGTVLGAIAAASEQDYYSVAVAALCVIQVSVEADPEHDGTSTDVVVELLDQNGNALLNPTPASAMSGNQEGPSAVGFVFVVSTPTPVNYYVRVRHASTGTGSYGLMVRRDVAEVEPDSWFAPKNLDPLYKLPNGSYFAMAHGAISPEVDTDSYRLASSANGRAWLLVDTGASSSGRDSFLHLTHDEFDVSPLETDDDDGTATAGDETIESSQASAIAGRLLPPINSRLVGVWSYNNASVIAAYTLYAVVTMGNPTPEVENNDSPTTLHPVIAAGNPIGMISGTVAAGGDVDFFSAEIAEGDILFVSLDCNPAHDGLGTDLALDLYAPDAATKLLTVNSSTAGVAGNPPAESFAYKAKLTGNYFIKVRRINGAGTGAYVLMAARSDTRLRIVSEKIAAPNVQLDIATMPERKYRVQYTDAMNDAPVWTTLPSTVTGSGLLQGYIHLNGATATKRFYRVMQVP